MTDDPPSDDERSASDGGVGDGSTRLEGLSASRRRVLYGAAVAGTAAGLGGLAAGQQAETIRMDGETAGWIGRAPPGIAGQTNPTLQLEAGTEYQVVWINTDGAPHNFVIRNDAGEDLVRSEIVNEQGQTQTVTFTASAAMTTYLCEVHPSSMVGDVEVSGGAGTPAGAVTGTETEAPDQGAGFFEEGTEVGVRTVAEGMTAPTDMAVADEARERYFVTDQTGEVWVVTPEGGRLDEPFLDVADRMVTLGEFAGTYAQQGQAYDERGLLGIEFHPDFAENRRFYLHYSAPRTDDMPENWDHVEVLSEFTASEDGDSADADSERRLLAIEHPQYNHDAGPLAFGPEGYLYFPMGDGGGRDDNLYGHVDDWYETNTGGNGQDVTDNLLGSVLRIDVDGGAPAAGGGAATPTETVTPGGTTTPGDGAAPYGIPADNPFVDDEGLDEIWAYGFRNPFGISFDSAGNCFVADAGQELWEEASVVEGGGNYGWNVKEGTHCFSTDDPGDPTALTDCPTNEPDEAPYDGGPLIDPVVEFPHNYEGEAVGITIVGGHRYENDAIPDLAGKYVFGAWTTDAAREAPAGRVLAATPPEDFDGGGMGTGTPTVGGGVDTATPAATDAGAETATEAGAGTTTVAELQVGEGTPGTTATPAGTETGTGTPATASPTTPEAEVPLEELWEMEELVFAGSQDGTLGYFVRMFGQDPDGNVYVLANRRGVPEGDTGVVMQLVPPAEGESIEPPTTATETPAGTPGETATPAGTDAETAVAGTETAETGTDDGV